MQRTTIFVGKDQLDELKAMAEERKTSMADLVREALDLLLHNERTDGKRFSFVAVGKSRKKNISEKHEDLLWQKERS